MVLFDDILNEHFINSVDNKNYFKYIIKYHHDNDLIYKDICRIIRFVNHDVCDKDGYKSDIIRLILLYKKNDEYFIDMWGKEYWFELPIEDEDHYYRLNCKYKVDNNIFNKIMETKYNYFDNPYYKLLNLCIHMN